MRQLRLREFAVVLAFILTACGGGSSLPAVSTSVTNGHADTASEIVQLSSQPSTVQFPVAGGIAGSITFPGVAAPSSVSLSSSAVAPPGFATAQSANRRLQSGTLSVFHYLTIVPKTTIALVSLPNLQLQLSPTFSTANQQFFYAISEPPAPGVQVQFLTEGPGVVNGSHVAFNASLTPLTLVAGQRYFFAFYALSTNSVSVNPPLLYVANNHGSNNSSNSITAYPLNAQGNAAPLRTVAGAATGLTNPLAVSVDPAGNIVVANAGAGHGSVEIFPDGANGNIKPMRTFSFTGTPGAIALDPYDASIYVSFSDAQIVEVFSATGTLLRTLRPTYGEDILRIQGLAVENNDRLLVFATVLYVDTGAQALLVFAPHAANSDPPIGDILDSQAFFAFAYASTSELSVVFNFGQFQELSLSGNVIRQSPTQTEQTFNTIAVDATGQNVYAIDAGVGPSVIFHDVAHGAALVSQAALGGSLTGLSPVSLTVGNP